MSKKDDMKVAPIQRPEILGKIIGDLRALQGMTQAELAERLGVSRQTVIKLEQGQTTRGVEVIVQALAQFGYVLQPVKQPHHE